MRTRCVPYSALVVTRALASLLSVMLILARPLLAFNTPLSEEAIREAYFLGQRHDESMLAALAKYNQSLPAPTYGPHIALVTYLTPFAQAVLLSSQKSANYSAQQAQLDHRRQAEEVQVKVLIRLTDSYGAYVPANSGSPQKDREGLVPRSGDFWRDFEVVVSDGKKPLKPTSVAGKPDYSCSRAGCVLIGATVRFDFPAEVFTTQDVTVQVEPPEGDQVITNFDLSQVR